jgi:5-oxoprolinase (ATP-hydrolysing) subunit A
VAIDLNSDVGESYGAWQVGDDEALIPLVTSANVACGFHGGDPTTLRLTCVSAVANGVAIGAQVGYPDLVGFGRRYVDMSERDLRDAVLYQLGALDAFAQVAGSEVAYVKPHGALYHATIDNEAQARAVVSAAAEYDPSLAVLGFPGSALLAAAERAELEPVPEAFVDRAYLPDGRLVPRSYDGAVITDAGAAAEQAVRIATAGEIVAIDGSTIVTSARSLCVHGDSTGAVTIAAAVRHGLEAAGLGVYSFAR